MYLITYLTRILGKNAISIPMDLEGKKKKKKKKTQH